MSNSGQLKKLVTLERAVITRGDAGSEVESWASLGKRWASIKTNSGAEKVEGQALESEITHRIRVRHDNETAALTTRDRITFYGREFDIKSTVNVREANRDIDILVTERV